MPSPAKRKGTANFQFRRATPVDILKARDALAAFGVRVANEATTSFKVADKRLFNEVLAIREKIKGESIRLSSIKLWIVKYLPCTERLLIQVAGQGFGLPHTNRGERRGPRLPS